MTAKAETISTLEAKYHDFHARIVDLPDDAYGEAWLGDWNLSQVLAHMAGWFSEMAAAIGRVSRGERPTPDGVDYNDVDAWNQSFAAGVTAGRSSLQAFDEAYAAYLDAAKALSDDQFGIDAEKGRPKIGTRLLQGAGIGHFEEHEPQLDEWLGRRR
ncbi:MAG: hypothetical protein C0506_10240 [Anaerolinea sp.]|nr:hypothetical protein [Anaerolinea sp.]